MVTAVWRQKNGFILGDKLPTNYDVAISISQVSTQRTRQHAQNMIHAYYLASVEAWAFGTGHVMSRKGITNKLEKLCDNYYNEVYNSRTETEAQK